MTRGLLTISALLATMALGHISGDAGCEDDLLRKQYLRKVKGGTKVASYKRKTPCECQQLCKDAGAYFWMSKLSGVRRCDCYDDGVSFKSAAGGKYAGGLTSPVVEVDASLPYVPEQQDWYQTLKATTEATNLSQSDFENGTYRIRTPGKYVLTEDIEFEPRSDLDFWPPFHSSDYPLGQFYLGFFAAITIETSDVYLDLNGFTIRQSELFYKKQRFFNVIELADRVFVVHEGVMSLNYQSNDKLQFGGATDDFSEPTRVVGDNNPASKVIVANGRLGRSSHNGIHGNGAQHVVIEDMIVEAFDVAGIQLNGSDNVAIRRSTVGPSHQEVSVMSSMNHIRFTQLYTQRLIPYGFARIGISDLLNTEKITFADRPDEEFTIGQVFDRLDRATKLFYGEEAVADEADAALLAEAQRLINNPSGLADGGAIYGIVLHRLGAGVDAFGAQDENYYGPEHFNIAISDVTVTGIKGAPVMVPALVFEDGTIAQGTVRDTLNFLMLASSPETGLLRTLQNARYHGNFLADAYFAMWQLSNAFYAEYILDSPCGNFASNGTPHYVRCNGIEKSTTLNGRDIVMMQKRFFGGIQLSETIYNWATDATVSLETVLQTYQDVVERRQKQTNIVCNGDTMFHLGKGVIGIKMEFVGDVELKNVVIDDLENMADASHWLCDQGVYRLRSTTQLKHIGTLGGGRYMGGDVRGIRISKSDRMHLNGVSLDNFHADEGHVFGLDVAPDANDRSDWVLSDTAVEFEQVNIGSNIRGGSGSAVLPVNTGSTAALGVGGITVAKGPDSHNQMGSAKTIIQFGVIGESVTDFNIFSDVFTDEEERQRAEELTGLEKIIKLKEAVLNFWEEQFGLDLSTAKGTPWYEKITMPNGRIEANIFKPTTNYGVNAICTKGQCYGPMYLDTQITDVNWVYYITPGTVYYGKFGGTEGWAAGQNDVIIGGTYGLLGVPHPEGKDEMVSIDFFASCPLDYRVFRPDPLIPSVPSRVRAMINCDLDSDVFGRGVARGVFNQWYVDPLSGSMRPFVLNVMEFDDDLPASYADILGEHTVNRPAHSLSPMSDWNDSHYNPAMTLQVGYDGLLGPSPTMAGLAVNALGKGYQFLNEAGIYYLRDHIGLDDDAIRAMRTDFIDYLVNEMGIVKIINRPLNSADYVDEPLDNGIAFGGGNEIVPYVVNEATNARVQAQISLDEQYTRSLSDARIFEGGFMLRVGRAGMVSSRLPGWVVRDPGYVPFGSRVFYGYYLIQLPEGDLKLKFRDMFFNVPNQFTHFEIQQRIDVVHPAPAGFEQLACGRFLKLGLITKAGPHTRDSSRSCFIWDKYNEIEASM